MDSLALIAARPTSLTPDSGHQMSTGFRGFMLARWAGAGGRAYCPQPRLACAQRAIEEKR